MKPARVGARACLAAALAAGAVLASCKTETRVIRRNSLLGGIQGAESGMPEARVLGDYADPTQIPAEKLVIEDKDKKTKTLIARSGLHLMVHIHNTLEENDKALFVSQVLSMETKREFFERAMDPGEAFDYLRKHLEDIDKLFAVMPQGEHTPGLFLKPMGGGVQRLMAEPMLTRDLMWGGMDMVTEKGNYRLRWFVPPER